MIDSAIYSIVEELNDSLNIKFRLNENRVIASNLLNLDGSLSLKDENRIVVSLVNLEEEKLLLQMDLEFQPLDLIIQYT